MTGPEEDQPHIRIAQRRTHIGRGNQVATTKLILEEQMAALFFAINPSVDAVAVEDHHLIAAVAGGFDQHVKGRWSQRIDDHGTFLV